MASTTTMNNWLDQLALSLVPTSTKPTDICKHKEAFARRVKHHPYGRTNQFAVAEKLTGLEEKFQVLNLDDLAEAIYLRRQGLEKHDQRWIPDFLDLLLHLSHDPVRNSRVENLPGFPARSETPPTLKWADIEAEDPIDRQSQIWSVPEFSDFSSDEDEIVVASTTTSPASLKLSQEDQVGFERIFDSGDAQDELSIPSQLESAQFWRQPDEVVAITERQAIKEVLFMLSGLPTSVFTMSDSGIQHDSRYRVGHLERQTSESILHKAALVGTEVACVRRWLSTGKHVSVMQLVHDCIRQVWETFQHVVTRMQDDILHEVSSDGVVSPLRALHAVQQTIMPLKAIAAVIPWLAQDDPVSALNNLHCHIDLAYACGDTVALETLTPIFLSASRLYARPIDAWLLTGEVEPAGSFFVSESSKPRNATTLWQDWFVLSEDGNEVPIFLRNFVKQIFAAGKTAAFLRHLRQLPMENGGETLGICGALTETAQLLKVSPLPLPATLEGVLSQHLTSVLVTSTEALKEILETNCGLNKLLDTFDYLYLGKDGLILDNVDNRLFDQIDRCMEMWNDRFLVADLVAEAYQSIECIEPDSVTIESTYTSSRSMETRRRSVRILAALTISYHLPWPMANIISSACIASYQRIALTLSQIRRARHVLERRAYFYVQNIFPLGGSDGPNDQKIARAVYMTLAHFVNVLYAHLTTCTIGPLTREMRAQLTAPTTGSIDDMITIHARYIHNLEHACLSSTRIKPLRDALLTILDLCIRFADLVSSSPATAAGRVGSAGPTDFEASSFTSAQSQHRRKRRAQPHQQDESSSDEDQKVDGDGMRVGHSTFLLDEDTSVVREVKRLREAFGKHVMFLLAGLRGVARNSGDVGDGLELLADSLEGVFPRKRNAFY
ncbi:hypothetical protein LTR47_010318 [Exophiala xenobiotica]|nr:hypothetical protein LTR47_010318 [Exophiala xenobiotica]KAK5249763.1 hypothetical protein LTS06_005398 [Exophiala xenobiotica]KAK5313250.1 hypothetical protein LTR93_010985 [Exophiala xenobiotica]KAK5345435.1 hypothetical protein LTR61_010811 [Exophiala xenobiotica]KAK5378268.1 hypothetical protein LTR11_003959 [Exophiala xenobiotica]